MYLGSKEGVYTEEFQKFINGPSGPGLRINALMNICKSIDISLMNGQTPCPRVFSEVIKLNLLKLR